jgi:hypothetical protein
MANSVYLVVCDALSHIVSRRAAENIVRDALRTIKSDPDAVTPREMQDMLKGQVFARLQQIIPVAQARGEIKTLLQKLEALNASEKPVLSPEVLEGLEALRAEFAPFVKLEHRRVKRIRAGIEVLPEAPDPVRALNSLWAELDLLFNEIGPDEPQAASQPEVAAPVMITSEMVSPQAVLEPVLAPKPSAHPTPVSGISSDGVLEIADDLGEDDRGEDDPGADLDEEPVVSTATVELGRYELPDAVIDPLDEEIQAILTTSNSTTSNSTTSNSTTSNSTTSNSTTSNSTTFNTVNNEPGSEVVTGGAPFLIAEFDEFGLEFELESDAEVQGSAVETELFELQDPEPVPVKQDKSKKDPSLSAEIDPAEELRRALEEEAALRRAFDEEAGLQGNASAAIENRPEPSASEPSASEPSASVANPSETQAEPSKPVTPNPTPNPKLIPAVQKSSAPRRAAVATKPRPKVAALSNEAQELLIARFALEEGVIGVTISNRAGQVSLSRMREGSAEDLAGMTAATAMLLESQRSFDVFYTDLGVANVFIAPLGESLLTVLADKQVNVGRVLSEVKTVKEEI